MECKLVFCSFHTLRQTEADIGVVCVARSAQENPMRTASHNFSRTQRPGCAGTWEIGDCRLVGFCPPLFRDDPFGRMSVGLLTKCFYIFHRIHGRCLCQLGGLSRKGTATSCLVVSDLKNLQGWHRKPHYELKSREQFHRFNISIVSFELGLTQQRCALSNK